MTGVLDPLRAAAERSDGSIRWSATVLSGVDAPTNVDTLDADVVLPTASIGKVFLLVTVVDALERGALDGREVLPVVDDDLVADSGLLQFLDGQALTVRDLCRFVGAVSDNLATNVLLRRVGLSEVTSTTARIGVVRSALHDLVRDRRGPEHVPFLSTGCASELGDVMRRLAAGDVIAPSVSAAVVEVLRLNTDLSMVASAFALDPLAHVDADVGVRMFNKTGTQDGTRADIGWVEPAGQGSGAAYAVVARFTDAPAVRRTVLDAMRAVGEAIAAGVAGQHWS
jgi:beta-lactamase class A